MGNFTHPDLVALIMDDLFKLDNGEPIEIEIVGQDTQLGFSLPKA